MIGTRLSGTRPSGWRRAILGALALAMQAAAIGCAHEAVPFADLGGDLEVLRAAFNQDVDKVRAVLLASPT